MSLARGFHYFFCSIPSLIAQGIRTPEEEEENNKKGSGITNSFRNRQKSLN